MLCMIVTGCETPINDVDLPPAPAAESADVIEGGAEAEDAALAAHDVPSAPDDVPSALDDVASVPDIEAASDAMEVSEGDAIPAAADPETCASAEACLAYWVAFSDCSVVVAGPDAAIDPSVYATNCAAACDLADHLDYIGHYACLSAGIPEDCAVEPARVPDCDI